MRCPTCKNEMIVVEHSKIELDYCTNCHGVWLDSQELELLLSSMGLDNRSFLQSTILSAPEAQSSEKRRRCPICSRKMKKNIVGQPAILIDVCHRGDGLWFDGGEVSALIKQLVNEPMSEGDSSQRILGFLGEVLKAQT